MYLSGYLAVQGEKHRVVKTTDYGVRKLSAMESALPVFSDMGSGVCDETGTGFVPIDPVFAETVELPFDYQVFITRTSEKAVKYVFEKTPAYFTVKGEPGATFDWAVYIPQKGFAENRLDENSEPEAENSPESVLKEYVKSLAEKDALLAVSGI